MYAYVLSNLYSAKILSERGGWREEKGISVAVMCFLQEQGWYGFEAHLMLSLSLSLSFCRLSNLTSLAKPRTDWNESVSSAAVRRSSSD